MFVHILPRHALQKGLTALGLSAAACLLLAYPAALSTGINRGLAVCSSVIIPTLYPFMLLSGLLADSSLCRRPGRLTIRLTRWLFGLPGCCGPAILLSLVGGYPAGALAIGRLRRQGLLTREQVRRMSLFCVGGGPGFIIGTVGSGLLGSTRAGVLLFAAHTAVSLLLGVWLSRGHRQEIIPAPTAAAIAPRPVAGLMEDTCRALLAMCGFVLVASIALCLFEALGLPHRLYTLSGVPTGAWSAALSALLEVSSGCIALAGSGELAPLWLSLCLSWCGLSVQGQLAAALGERGCIGLRFWGWRLLHGLLSGALALLLFRLFPAQLPTITTPGGLTALPYTVSFAASGMLLLLTFLAMLYFSPKKTGKI